MLAQASLRLGCELVGLMRGIVFGTLPSGGLPKAGVSVRERRRIGNGELWW